MSGFSSPYSTRSKSRVFTRDFFYVYVWARSYSLLHLHKISPLWI